MSDRKTDPNLFLQTEALFRAQEENTLLKQKVQNLELKIDLISTEAEYLKPDKTFGLAVSGDVHLNKLEVKIISTKTFQRLRKVRQLGTTYMVYPSAVHTRFEHCLGVLSKADLMIRRIRENRHSINEEKKITSEEEQIIRLLALLHDIGHMPFGHTIEDEFGIFKSHDKHETRWQYLLGEFSEIGEIIVEYHKENNPKLFTRFFRLIKCEKDFRGFEDDAFMYDIVSNTVCADLLDYLERDCLYTNLKLKYHPRFLDYFFIKKGVINKETSKPEKRIAIRIYKKGRKKEIRHDVITELIQLLKYRYFLGERVYYHHAKIVTGTMLAGAVLRAKTSSCFKPLVFSKQLKKAIEAQSIDMPSDKIMYDIHKMGDEELVIFLKKLLPKPEDELKATDFNSDDEYNVYSMKQSAGRLAHLFDDRILFQEIKYWTKTSLQIERDHIKKVDEFDKNYKEKEFGKCNLLREQIGGTKAFRIYDKLLREGTSEERLEIENSICTFLPDMQPGDVLLYCPSFNMAMKLARMKVAYISENSNPEREEVDELQLFKFSTDETTILECSHILKRHEELWAFRIFINPKFYDINNEHYDKKYEKYHLFIEDYIEWCVLNRNDEDEKIKGEHFLNSYLRFRKHLILPQEKMLLLNDEDIDDLVGVIVNHANAKKDIRVIDSMIWGKVNGKNQ